MGVEFYAEIFGFAAWVVACGKENAAHAGDLVLVVQADQVRDSRRRKMSLLPNDNPTNSVGSSDAKNLLDGNVVPKATITRHHEAGVGGPRLNGDAVKNRLHEIVKIVLLLEDLDLLPEATGACFLVRVGLSGILLYLECGLHN